MRSGRTRVSFWRRPLAILILVILLFVLLVTAVSANGLSEGITDLSEQLKWVTICHHSPGDAENAFVSQRRREAIQHHPPGDAENAQTMVIYWSALDKCLSHFGDFIGACP